MVGNDYKWMMNFCGTGFAFISPRLQPLILHWGAGWMSDTDRFDTSKDFLTLRQDAGRFEIGYPHADGIYGLGLIAAQNLLLGPENVEHYVCELANYFRTRVAESGNARCVYAFAPENCCQIVYIKVAADCTLTNEKLQAANISAKLEEPDAYGERGMRLSFHLYNNKEDIDRFFALLAECGGSI